VNINGFKRTSTKDVFEKLDELDNRDDRREIDTSACTSDDSDDTAEAAEATSTAEKTDATEQPDANADEASDANSTPCAGRRRLRRLAVFGATLVCFAALGSSGYLGWQLKQRDDTSAAAQAALAVARTYAVTLTSVDSKDIDQNFNQVLGGATGEFKDMYSQSAAQLRQILVDNKAVSKGIVVDAAVKSATKAKVDVLLFVDQSISNAVVNGPRIDRNRIEMTMELIDNHWLASHVDIK